MATTVGQPPGVTPEDGRTPGSESESESEKTWRSARAALARRQSPRVRIVRLAILVVAVVILARAWAVTEIDLGKLTNAPNATPILKALIQPDIAARDVTLIELQEQFVVGEGPEAAVVSTNQSGQSLRVTPGAAVPGQTVTLEGSGFAPDTDAQVRIQDASRGLDKLLIRVHTDGRGTFQVETVWPNFDVLPAGTYTLRLLINAPTGALHPSETFTLSVGRIGETILLALMGTVFGVLFSAPLSFLGARNLMTGTPVGQAIYWFVRVIFTITRSVEVLILGVIMVVIVGIGSYAGVLAIVVHSIGSLGKLYSEAIESIEPGPVEAITATGADRLSTVLYGVVPQVIPNFLAVTIYWWDHNVRMSTVLGLVGGGGIGYLLIQYMNLLQFNQAATVLWMIVIVVTVMDYASAAIRARLV